MRPASLAALVFASGLALATLAATPGESAAREWQMIDDGSSLEFTFRQMGSAVTGQFRDFATEITFDPDDLANASVSTEIAIDSVDTGNAERDAGITGADWFDTATYPTATFASTSFAHAGGDDYVVTGDLTVRDITETIDLPFTIVVDGDSATANGTIELDRRTFEVGRGDWASDAAVGYDVILRIEVTAEAVD
jgi:polyisoprenoid-binding protein YceI